MVAMQMPPDNDWAETKSNYLSRWDLVQKIFQNFWKQWRNEYLNQLQVRNKWYKNEPEVEIDDMVMVKDENLPVTKWTLGRVVQKHPGNDGKTRVVSVKTSKNVLKRTITKIAPMPHNEREKTTALTVLLAALVLLPTTNAHSLTIFDTEQKLENKQNINISLHQSNNFALFTVLGIFVILFFLFLMFILRILYKGATTTEKAITVAQNTVAQEHTQAVPEQTQNQTPSTTLATQAPLTHFAVHVLDEHRQSNSRRTSIALYPALELATELKNLANTLNE